MEWLLLAASVVSADAVLPPAVRRVTAPRDAATAALLDLGQNVPREAQPFQWYVWNNAGSKQSAAALNFTVNAVISRAATIIQPAIVSDGPLLRYELLRYDLRELTPRRADFERLWRQLQDLAQFEPYFHQPGHDWLKVRVDPYLERGHWFDWKWHKARDFGLHAGGAGPLRVLSELMGGNRLPIVRGDWLLATAWSSVDIAGIRGSYYELAGIEANPRGRSAFDAFLESVGADEKLVAKLQSDQRAVTISGVTGKWRMVEAFPTAGARPEFGPSLITITHDIKDEEADAKRHALLNLIEFKEQAREVIAARTNGLHLFALFDGQGNLQDEAPPDVAAWPASPHVTKRLVAGIACVECHGANRGYNPLENYVQTLERRGFAAVLDLASPAGAAETLDRLRGLYGGDLTIPLKAAGNAYARACDQATWGVFGPAAVEGASAEVYHIYSDYFAKVTPGKLLRELGYEVAEEQAVAALQRIVPSAKGEDGRIGAVRLCLPILRGDVHEIFFEVALRDVLKPKETK
jgi:hypothetical protein